MTGICKIISQPGAYAIVEKTPSCMIFKGSGTLKECREECRKHGWSTKVLWEW